MVRLYGPRRSGRGGTVAFNLLDPRGRWSTSGSWPGTPRGGLLAADRLLLQPGRGRGGVRAEPDLDAAAAAPGVDPIDEYLDALGLPTGGAVRVSFGLASTATDAHRFVDFVQPTYLQPECRYASHHCHLGCAADLPDPAD